MPTARRSEVGNVLENVPKIARMIREGAITPRIRQWASQIVNRARIEGRDELGEIRAIFSFVQDEIPYRKDPVQWEALQSSGFQLESFEAGAAGGDCDDMTIALGALLGSLGHRTRLVVTRPDRVLPFGHIYPEVYSRMLARWIPLDATNASANPGWEFPDYAERRVYPMSTNGFGESPLDFLSSEAEKAIARAGERLQKHFEPDAQKMKPASILPVLVPASAASPETKKSELKIPGFLSGVPPLILIAGAAALLLLILKRRGR